MTGGAIMEAVREAVSERVITLMTPSEKARLEDKARQAKISVGEFVRRSVDAYNPDEIQELEQLADLARAFRESAERASAAVDRSNRQVLQTIEFLRRNRES
jgi:hypothetical protein